MNEIFTGGVVGGGIVFVAYVGRLALDAWQAKRRGDIDEATTPVANAAIANAMLKATLESVGDRLSAVEAEAKTARDDLARERALRQRVSERLDEHDKEIGIIKRQFALAMRYISQLRDFITAHGLTDQAPEPPPGLHVEELRDR